MRNINTTKYPCSELQRFRVSMRFSGKCRRLIVQRVSVHVFGCLQLSFSEMSQVSPLTGYMSCSKNHKVSGVGGGGVWHTGRPTQEPFWKWRLRSHFAHFLFLWTTPVVLCGIQSQTHWWRRGVSQWDLSRRGIRTMYWTQMTYYLIVRTFYMLIWTYYKPSDLPQGLSWHYQVKGISYIIAHDDTFLVTAHLKAVKQLLFDVLLCGFKC